MTKRELIKAEIKNRVNKLKDQSFYNIEQIFEEFEFDYYEEGKFLAVPNNTNTILWVDWNDEAMDLLTEVIDENDFNLSTAHPIVYMIDGKMVNLPIAKNFSHPYKYARWIPTLLVPSLEGGK
jgi:hypothetical protein